MKFQAYIFQIIFLFPFCFSSPDYYWRFYESQIPPDAFKAGSDRNGTFYIGLAYLHGYGLIPAKIHLGEMQTELVLWDQPFYDVQIVEILCTTKPENLRWTKAASWSYRGLMIPRMPVLGGYLVDRKDNHEAKKIDSVLHIGKTTFEDETDWRVGYAVYFQQFDGSVFLHFADKGLGVTTGSFFALMYDEQV